MKFEPLLKKKKSLDEQIIEIDVQLRLIDKKLHVVISRELRTLQYNKNNIRSKDKIKSAVFSLIILNSAQEILQDIDTTNELNKTMNNLGAALKSINGIYDKSEKFNEKKFDKSLTKMNDDSDKSGGMALVSLSDKLDSLVSEDIIEQLLSGKDIDTCLANMGDDYENIGQSVFANSEILNGLNFDDGDVENSSDLLDEFINLF